MICEGLLLIFFSIMMKKWLLLNYKPISKLECKNYTLFMTNMAEISLNWYPIYDQKSRKTIPFGAAHTYIAHIREYPPGVGQLCRLDRWSKICLNHGTSKEPVNPWPERIHRFLWCTMIQTDLGSPIRIRPHSKGTRPIIYSSAEDRLRTWRFTMFTLDEILHFVVKDVWIFQAFALHDFKIPARESSRVGQKFLLTEQFLQ